MNPLRHPEGYGPVKLLLILLVLMSSGCRQQNGGKLLGTWIGRPDTVAMRDAREAEKYGKPATAEGSERFSAKSKEKSDWETYGVEVLFEFRGGKQLEMSLADKSEPVTATWRVLESTPTGCTIEVVTATASGAERVEVRQFELEFDERQGQLVGFLLTESGADRQLGSLYFSRENN